MNIKGELIVIIINKGYSDLAMNAARSCGARGGTILNARGTGNDEIEKFFGVPIQPEKELILIVVDKEITENVLMQIYKEAGLETKGQGIAFSIPVDDMIGFQAFEEDLSNLKLENENKIIE